MIGCFNCSITANCPITLSDCNCTELLVKNEEANVLIIFEEFVMVMIMMVVSSTYMKSNMSQIKFIPERALFSCGK